MVRREEAGTRVKQVAASCCTSPTGASPVSASAGAPSSRPQASEEIPVARAGCRKPLRRKQARGPQLKVKPAASIDLQPESRAAHVTVKATSAARISEEAGAAGLGGVWGAARVQGVVRNTRDPSGRPVTGQAGSYKPKAKSSGAQRESEGIVVLWIAATNNAAGGKGPCGGFVERTGTCEGMTGKTGSNHPAGRESGVKVRHPGARLGFGAKPWTLRGAMCRPERPLGKPCAGNPHARFERGSCPHPVASLTGDSRIYQ
jgi:hypothetical protein